MTTALVITALVLIAIAAAIPLLKKNNGTQKAAPTYTKKANLLTPAERSFFGVLQQATANNYEIFVKVRIADVISPSKSLDKSHWQRAFNKIASKHFDYVLCDPATLDVKKVIELNDKSHNKKSRKARDELVKQSCDDADLELIFITAKAAYNPTELAKQVST